jgi:hypothetical protein
MQFTRIAVSQRTISFETETIDGISYRLTGQFDDYTCDPNNESHIPPLTGWLTKIDNGKWSGQAHVDLWEYDGC